MDQENILKSNLWKEIEVKDILITKKGTNGERKESIKAAVLRNLAVHQGYDGVTITHIKSGFALVHHYIDIKAALLGMVMIYYTLGKLPDPFEIENEHEVVKDETSKKIYNFISKHKKVWNNAELESSVGVFYQDRADCEKLRREINPDNPYECLDDYALLSGEVVGDLIMREVMKED